MVRVKSDRRFGENTRFSPVQGIEAFNQLESVFYTAFPELRSTLEVIIAAGDKGAVHMISHTTHTRELMGIPPTCKQVTCTANSIFR